MWFVNVVEIITFLFFILYAVVRTIKQRDLVSIVFISLAVIFEGIFIVFQLINKTMGNAMQVAVLVFAYVIPMGMFALRSANKSFKIKIVYAIAKLAFVLKRYEFCEGILNGAIKTEKNNKEVYYLRSKALKKLVRIAEARDMMFKVIELDKENAKAYFELAGLLDMLDKKDTAIVMLATALKIYPEYEEAREMMGIMYSEIGRYKEAASIYEETNQNGEGNFNTYYNLAIIYSKQGDMERAIDAYKMAIEKDSKAYDVYYSLGRLYFANNEFEKSIEVLSKALKDSNLKSKVYYALAMDYIKLKDYEQSADYLEKAVKLDKQYIKMAKNSPIFSDISAEVNRLEDENSEFIVETFEPEMIEEK